MHRIPFIFRLFFLQIKLPIADVSIAQPTITMDCGFGFTFLGLYRFTVFVLQMKVSGNAGLQGNHTC